MVILANPIGTARASARPAVWQRWLDSNQLRIVPSHADALCRLRAISIGAGTGSTPLSISAPRRSVHRSGTSEWLASPECTSSFSRHGTWAWTSLPRCPSPGSAAGSTRRSPDDTDRLGAGDAVGRAQAGRGGGGGVRVVQAEQGGAGHRRDVDDARPGRPGQLAASCRVMPEISCRFRPVMTPPRSTTGVASPGEVRAAHRGDGHDRGNAGQALRPPAGPRRRLPRPDAAASAPSPSGESIGI